MNRIRSVLSALLVATLAAGSAMVSAAPASASVRTDSRATWAYTDARAPFRSFVDTDHDAPLGIWRDAAQKLHFSKAYFTFDIGDLRGARILRATAFTAETHANDCTVERATQLWQTDLATQPTFAGSPKERLRWDTASGGPCLSSRVEWEVADGLRQAVASGQSRVTVAMRLSDEHQFDPGFGRQYANDLRLTIEYNVPPNLPVALTTDLRPCANGPFLTANQHPELAARISDPDGDNVSARFAIWPIDMPDVRTEWTTVPRPSGAVVSVIVGPMLEHGRTYQWQVRAEDGGDVSAWTDPCQFTTDFVAPEVAPTVSSTVYSEDCFPCGGVGVPGDFTFTANGVADVVGFFYGPNEFPSTFVAADQPGGQATIFFTPQVSGVQSMFVQSVDAAGNKSATFNYRYFVD